MPIPHTTGRAAAQAEPISRGAADGPARPRRARLAVAGSLAAAALACAPLAVASPALAHDELVGRDFVLANGSDEIEAVKLSYSGEIMDVGTEITVTDASGADVVDGPPELDGHDVLQPVETPDADGSPYTVSWRVVSSDGHPIEGRYAFEVLPDGSAEITESDTDAEGADDSEGDTSSEDAAADATAEDAGDSALLPVLAAVGGVVVVALAAILIVRKARSSGAGGASGGAGAEETGGEDRA